MWEQFCQPALPTDDVVALTKKVKPQVEQQAEKTFSKYTPVLFTQGFTAAIGPTFYRVKVHVGLAYYIQVGYEVWEHSAPIFNMLIDPTTKEHPIRPQPSPPPAISDAGLPTLLVQIGTREVKSPVEKAIGFDVPQFNAVLFREQKTRKKTNYWLKVQTSDENYAHVYMYTDSEFSVLPSLIFYFGKCQYPKKRQDPIEIFS